MPINKTNLESLVQARINEKTEASATKDIVADAIAVSQVSADFKNAVNTADDLPDLSLHPIPNGTTVFVESLNVPVIASNEEWLGLDGRLLRNDASTKTLWGWGYNAGGQIGDGTTTNRSSPVSVVGGFTDWCQVSAGSRANGSVLAVNTSGYLWGWGSNYCNIISCTLAGSSNISSPVSSPFLKSQWHAVSTGCFSAIGLTKDGSLFAWGSNSFGVLGSFVVGNASSPVPVLGGFTDWCQVSLQDRSVFAIRTNGTLWSWGYNGQGRLGDGTTVTTSSPVSVVGGFTDWCQVSAGSAHTAAVRTNGTLWAWGNNGQGRLGDGTSVNKSSPVSVIGGFTDWCQVSAGVLHTAAIRTNGTLWAWGFNSLGRLGDGTLVSRTSPVSVVGGFTDWCQVSAGSAHTAAIRTNGTLWTWGSNTCGRLGDGTTDAKSSPVSVVGGFTDWCQVSAGYLNTAALRIQQ